MAVLEKLREFFVPRQEEADAIVPAPETAYQTRILTIDYLREVWKLNQRCFKSGENYPRHTLSYLLLEPNTLSYCAVAANEEIVGFVFITVQDGTGHISTIGVAPEHRRRGLARNLMIHAEKKLKVRGIRTMCLEVRISNEMAQQLYRELNFSVIQRLSGYYSNGEDGFLMVKSVTEGPEAGQ